MPRLPDATAFGNRPTPQPQLGTVSIGDGDPSALMAGPGQTLKDAQGAYGMADLALADRKEFEAKAKVEQEKTDRMQAEDAYNKLQQRRIDLTVGDGGFTKVKGIDATKQPLLKDYGDKLGGYANEISQGLANDNQRALFQSRATVTRMGLGEDILRHQMAENKVAAANTFKSTLAVERDKASVNFNNPGDVNASLVRIGAAIEDYGRNDGWSDVTIKAEKQAQFGLVHDTVIDRMTAAGNLVGARAWYEANKEDVDRKTAEALDKKTVDAVQRQAQAGWRGLFLTIQDDNAKLNEWLKGVHKDPNLSEQSRNVLIDQGQRERAKNQLHADSVADRALRAIDMERRSIETQIGQGRELTLDEEARLIDQGRRNPSLQGPITDLINLSRETRNFRLANPMEQERIINETAVGVRDGTKKPRLLSTMQSIKSAGDRLMAEAPVTYGIQQGMIKPTDLAAQPLDLTNPGGVNPNQLQARFTFGEQVAARRGGILKPLQPEEINRTVDWFSKQPVDAQSKWLGDMYLATGSNKAQFRALSAQIFRDNPVLANAAALAYGQVKDPSVPASDVAAAQTVLKGYAMLFPDRGTDGKSTKGMLITMPDEVKMRKDWDSKVGAAYSFSVPQAGSDAFQVARSAYAGMVGRVDKTDYSVLDPDAWDKAVKVATGGVTKYNGVLTVIPRGMTESEMRDGIQASLKAIDKGGGLGEGNSYSAMADLPLMPAGDGKFYLRNGIQPQAGKDGRPILIDLTQPLPPELRKKPVPGDAYSEAMKNDVSFEGLVRGLAGRPLKDKPAAPAPAREPDDARRGELGVLKRPDGGVSTELSVTITDDRLNAGKATNVPLLVKGQKGVEDLLAGKEPTDAQVQFAIKRAQERVKAGGTLPGYASIADAEAAAKARPVTEKMKTRQ